MRFALELWLGVTAFAAGATGVFGVLDNEAREAFVGAVIAIGNALFLVAMLTGAV